MVQPKSKAVSLTHVSEMGIHQVRTKSTTLYEGRGYEAPKGMAKQSHPRGSQGQH
jgi:hypothetical protein